MDSGENQVIQTEETIEIRQNEGTQREQTSGEGTEDGVKRKRSRKNTTYEDEVKLRWNIVILAIAFFIAAIAIFSYVKLRTKANVVTYEDFVSTLKRVDTSDWNSLANGFIVYTTDEDLVAERLDDIELVLRQLPEEFSDELRGSKWRFAFIQNLNDHQEQLLADMLEVSSVQLSTFRGLTVPSSKLIIIQLKMGTSTQSDGSIFRNVLMHELGHYIQINYITDAEYREWEEVYSGLANNIKWVNIDPSEAFSEIFSDVMLSGVVTHTDEEFKQYQYIEQLVTKYFGVEF